MDWSVHLRSAHACRTKCTCMYMLDVVHMHADTVAKCRRRARREGGRLRAGCARVPDGEGSELLPIYRYFAKVLSYRIFR